MNRTMVAQRLVDIADELDSLGLIEEANEVDDIVQAMVGNGMQRSAQIRWKQDEGTQGMFIDQRTGLPSSGQLNNTLSEQQWKEIVRDDPELMKKVHQSIVDTSPGYSAFHTVGGGELDRAYKRMLSQQKQTLMNWQPNKPLNMTVQDERIRGQHLPGAVYPGAASSGSASASPMTGSRRPFVRPVFDTMSSAGPGDAQYNMSPQALQQRIVQKQRELQQQNTPQKQNELRWLQNTLLKMQSGTGNRGRGVSAQRLVDIADELDSLGLIEEANEVDDIVQAVAGEGMRR